jgi:hypothetical protein
MAPINVSRYTSSTGVRTPRAESLSTSLRGLFCLFSHSIRRRRRVVEGGQGRGGLLEEGGLCQPRPRGFARASVL